MFFCLFFRINRLLLSVFFIRAPHKINGQVKGIAKSHLCPCIQYRIRRKSRFFPRKLDIKITQAKSVTVFAAPAVNALGMLCGKAVLVRIFCPKLYICIRRTVLVCRQRAAVIIDRQRARYEDVSFFYQISLFYKRRPLTDVNALDRTVMQRQQVIAFLLLLL